MGSPIFPPVSVGGGTPGGLELGETSSTAYRGDRGKTAYDHTSLTNNPHSVTAAQTGAEPENANIQAHISSVANPHLEPRENLIINGDFSIAQRGTSFTSTTWRTNADDSYLLDRWLLLSDGNDIVDVTQISGAFSRSRYALQAEVETANKKFGFCQIIEANSCIPLRGQKISVSFAAKTVTAKVINNIRVAVLEWTGTADTVTSDVVSEWAVEGTNPTWAANWAALNTPANLAITTSEQTFKVENLTVGASCNNLAVFVWVDDTDASVDDILQLGEVQLVRGSVAPEFVALDYVDAIDGCLRRFRPIRGIGKYESTTSVVIAVELTPAMAASPTAIFSSGTINEIGIANRSMTGISSSTFNSLGGFVIFSTASATSGNLAFVLAGSAVYLEAEL